MSLYAVGTEQSRLIPVEVAQRCIMIYLPCPHIELGGKVVQVVHP